ncbi:MAG: fibronectin type III domain-containing protein [Bacteroidota bacterium]
MRAILTSSILLMNCIVFSQVTVTINCTGTPGSYNSGTVSSAGIKTPGVMANLNNSSANRGWASFDLSGIPAGVNFISASLRFTTFNATSSDSYNDLYGFGGSPAVTNGTSLFAQCGSGSSFNNSNWLANGVNTDTFNAAGLAFLAANSGSPVNIGFARSGSNNYSIYGFEAAADSQPQLTITYALLPCTGAPAGGVTNSTFTSICDPATPYTLTVSGAAGINIGGLTFQWQSGADTINWTDVPGASDRSLTQTQGLSRWYRRKTGCGTDYGYSTPKKIYINELSSGGTIFGTRFFCNNGQPVKLYIKGITNTTMLSYQWELSPDGTVYSNIPGAIHDTLNTIISAETWYRRKTICGGNIFYSNTRRIQQSSNPIIPVYKDFIGEGNACLTPDSANRWTVSPEQAAIGGMTSGYTGNRQNLWLFSPGILLTGQKTYRVRYYRYMHGTDTEACSITLKAGRAASADSMAFWMMKEESDANWPPFGSLIGYIYAEFTPPTTGTYYFGWGYGADGPTTVTINDLSVKLSPSCPAPVNLTVSNLTPASATFNWQLNPDNGNDTVQNFKWRIERNGHPFADSGFVTGNQMVVSNLVPDTSYTFRVFSNCGEASTPPYSPTATIVFRTPGINDECSGVVEILQTTYSDSCTGRFVSTFYGSPSGNPSLCNNTDFDDDVWYKFTALHTSAILKIKNYKVVSCASTGLVNAVYQDSCNTPTAFGCDFIALPLGYGEKFIQGLTVGKTYYLRLASKGLGSVINFNFCVMVPDLLGPSITAINGTSVCAGSPVNLSGAHFNGTTSVKLGTMSADSFSIVSSNSIKAYFNKAHQGYITVATPRGTSTFKGNLVTIKSSPVLPITGPCCLGGNENIIVSSEIGLRGMYLGLDGRGEMDVKMYEWNLNGKTVAGGNGIGAAPNQFNAPFGITKDAMGNLYVADAGNHRIQKFLPGNNNGITVAGGNGAGAGANQLNNPRGVFVDANGNIYVADAGNNRIQKWLPNSTGGSTVAGGNGFGIAANQFNFPHGVVVNDSGYIYVADANNNRVQKFAPGNVTGVTVAGGNGGGSAANQLNYATGVFVDPAGIVYVNDFLNNRIQKWAAGAVTGITVAGGNGAGSGIDQLDSPRGLFVDYYGNVYVADQNNSRIQKWPPGSVWGETIAGGNGAGGDSNQLAAPAAIFGENTDKGIMYVVDRLNNRVQQFSFPTTYSFKPLLPGVYQASPLFVNGCYNWTGDNTINPGYSTTICPGGRIYFLSANAGPGNTYQWQVNNGSGFVNIVNGGVYSGTGTDSIWLNKPPTSWYGNIYRCVVNGNVLSPEYQLKFAVRWTGFFDEGWEGTYNWDCGILPDENTDVIIKTDQFQTRFPVISSNAVCGSLKLDPGATLTVKSSGKLDIKRKN